MTAAMEAAAETALALEPEPAAELLEKLAANPLAAAPVRGKLQDLLGAWSAAREAEEAAAAAEEAEAEAEAAAEAEGEPAGDEGDEGEAEEAEAPVPERVTIPMGGARPSRRAPPDGALPRRSRAPPSLRAIGHRAGGGRQRADGQRGAGRPAALPRASGASVGVPGQQP